MTIPYRKPQVCVLGSAEPDSRAYELAGDAGEALAKLGITVVSGCGSPATRVAAERSIKANGLVLSIVPPDHMPPPDWPAAPANSPDPSAPGASTAQSGVAHEAPDFALEQIPGPGKVTLRGYSPALG